MAPLGLRQAGLLLWVLLLGCVGSIAGQTVPFFDNRTSIRVCTSETTPMVSCAGLQPDDYSGYEIALFSKTRQRLGWEDYMLDWTCYDWDTLIDHLASDDGVCDIAVAGINVATEYLDKGILFSFPTYRNGLKVMVAIRGNSVDYWAFMNAFSWEVWMAIVLTALITATILWGIELWATVGEKSVNTGTSSGTRDLLQTMWLAMGRPMQASDLLCQSFAANLIVIVYAFLILIMVTLYTANTAANITAIRLESTIHGIEDLPGRAVGTWEGYVPDLRKKGISAYGFPWNSEEDERAMADALRSGRIQALILDASFLEYVSADDCSLMLVGDTFHLFDQAVAFPRGFNNSELLYEINNVLVELQENGESEDLISEYINLPQPSCKTGAVETTTTAITFSQVAGLWILLGGSVVVAVFLAGLHQFAVWNTRRVARTNWYKQKKLRMDKMIGRVNNLLPRNLNRGQWHDSGGLDSLDLQEPTTPKVSFMVPYGSAKKERQQQQQELQGAEASLRQALDVLQWLQQEQQRQENGGGVEEEASAAEMEALAATAEARAAHAETMAAHAAATAVHAEALAARAEAEELQQRLRVAEAARAEAEGEASLLKKELEALQMKASRPQGSAAAMRSAQAADQTAAVAAAAEQLQGQVEQLEEELTRLQQDKSELGAKVESLRQQNALLQDNLALVRDERDQLMDVLNEREGAAGTAEEDQQALELHWRAQGAGPPYETTRPVT